MLWPSIPDQADPKDVAGGEGGGTRSKFCHPASACTRCMPAMIFTPALPALPLPGVRVRTGRLGQHGQRERCKYMDRGPVGVRAVRSVALHARAPPSPVAKAQISHRPAGLT